MATYFRLLDPMRQFNDGNGAPYSGGKLYFDTAGTGTAKTTYKDNAGVTQHAYPIVLNSAGRIDDQVWGTTGDYKLTLHTSADVLVDTEDNVTPVNDVTVSAASEWVARGLTPTCSSATVFTLVGDQTAIFHLGRRLKFTDATVLYGAVVTTAFAASTTTVTVLVSAAGVLSESLTAVSYGLLSAKNTSSPSGLTFLSGAISASAASIDIDAATFFTTDFGRYKLFLRAIAPVTAADEIILQVKIAGAFLTTGYVWHTMRGADTADAYSGVSSTGVSLTNGIYLAVNGGNSVNDRGMYEIDIDNPSAAGILKRINWHGGYGASAGVSALTSIGSGIYHAGTGAVTGIRLICNTGNILGSWSLYGVRTS